MTKTFVPHDYQVQAMRHVHANRRCGLWMPMGSGKSVTTLTALDQLSMVEDVFPALVLAPLRVAKTTWPAEVALWSHLKHLRISVITGTPAQRLAALRAPADIYATNYDNLDWLFQQEGRSGRFKTFVADEWTRLKSFRLRQGGSRARALGKMMTFADGERFIGLTGTPAPNGIKDLWGQLWYVDQGARLGKTFSAFEQRWFYKGYDDYSLQPHDHAQQEIEALLRDVCLTVTGLPVDAPIVSPVYVDLDRKARDIYDQMEDEFYTEVEEHGVEAANAAVKAGRLMQIANGALYIDDDRNWRAIHGHKIDALESIISEANGAPVLVAYNFRHDLERLLKAFPQGQALDTDPKSIERWNAGGIPVLFCHPASAGHGLSLQHGGNILARFGFDWNLESYMQMLERIGPTRQRQSGYDRPVFDYPILARRTIDEVVFDRLHNKRSVQDALLAGMARRKETR